MHRILVLAMMLIFATPLVAHADVDAALKAFRAEDYATALAGFEAGAKTGDPKAEYWLGHLYANGLGVKKDGGTAAKWLEMSANQGLVEAMRDLGIMYLRGDGVLQDYEMAHKWLEKAAYSNDSVAQRELGTLYAKGEAVKKDKLWAYVWFDYAAKNGDTQAQELRADLEKTMSASEISQAQDLAMSIKGEVLSQ